MMTVNFRLINISVSSFLCQVMQSSHIYIARMLSYAQSVLVFFCECVFKTRAHLVNTPHLATRVKPSGGYGDARNNV